MSRLDKRLAKPGELKRNLTKVEGLISEVTLLFILLEYELNCYVNLKRKE